MRSTLSGFRDLKSLKINERTMRNFVDFKYECVITP